MFYGLSRYLKKILPKQLFYRSLIIVAAPIIIMQITISIVFFDSLWIKTNKGMTRALVNEISTFAEAYNNENFDKDEITNLFSLYQDLNIEFVQDENFAQMEIRKKETLAGIFLIFTLGDLVAAFEMQKIRTGKSRESKTWPAFPSCPAAFISNTLNLWVRNTSRFVPLQKN